VTALLRKLEQAARERRPRSLLLTGGVAANRRLRRDGAALAERLGLPLFVPPIALSTDNAAMIGAARPIAVEGGARGGWAPAPAPPSDDAPRYARRRLRTKFDTPSALAYFGFKTLPREVAWTPIDAVPFRTSTAKSSSATSSTSRPTASSATTARTPWSRPA